MTKSTSVKLQNLLNDKAFFEKFISFETLALAHKYISSHDVSLTDKEAQDIWNLARSSLNLPEKCELSEDELKNIAGSAKLKKECKLVRGIWKCK